ncbi:MAG: hypothetical protein ACI4LB_04560 [Candidatus Fimenecus sp.]
MTQFFKNGLVGLLGYLAAEAVMLAAYMLRENSFFKVGSDYLLEGISFILSLAVDFLVGLWRGKRYNSGLKTVCSVTCLTNAFLVLTIVLILIKKSFFYWLAYPAQLPGEVLCMAIPYEFSTAYEEPFVLIGALVTVMYAPAVGALFSHDTAE